MMKSIVLGCAGTSLTVEERSLFAEYKPTGLILFKRNCVSKAQVSELVSEFKDIIGWNNAPILIDQEGGTVSRLKSPEWTEFPAPIEFAKLAESDRIKAKEMTYWNSVLMGAELAEIGVTVNCAPVMDVPSADCHEFLANSRVYGSTAEQVTELALEVCRGLLAVGVTPIMKHIPGHGRGTVDSHKDLPHVLALQSELEACDYMPFKELSSLDIADSLWAMGAHIIYDNIDSENPATLSKKIVSDVIRNQIGFDGVLIADDIGMEALKGSLADRALATLNSGMDLTLHCSGVFSEMQEVLKVLPDISENALKRIVRAEEMRINLKDDKVLLEQALDKAKIS